MGFGNSGDTPGAPGSPGRGSGRGNAGFGSEVDTGGVAPGQGRGLGRNVGRGSGGIGPASTHTNIPGARNHSAPPDSAIGTGINTGTRDNPSLTGDTRADRVGQTRSERRAMGLYDSVMTDGITRGAIATMDEAAEQAERSFMSNLDAAPQSHAQAEAEIQANARPGILGRAVGLIGGVMGGPVGALAGTAVNTALSARQAAQNIGRYNDMVPSSNLDESFGHSLGRQSLASVGGLLGGRLGGRAGSALGAAVGGVPGAIAGGLLGGAAGGSLGRTAAFSPGGSTPGTGMGDGMAPSNQPSLASAPTAGNSGVTPPSFEFADFDGYASYAEQFFT